MNKEFKFSTIKYKTPNKEKIIFTLKENIELLMQAKTVSECKKAISKWNRYISSIETDFTLISVRYTLDTANKKYIKDQETVDEITPIVSKYSHEYTSILCSSPMRKELEKIYGSYLFKMYDNSLKTFKDCIVDDLIEENKLTSQYDAIMGGAQIEFNGGTYNLSQLSKFMQDKDRNIRLNASVAMDKWMQQNEDKIADIYSRLVLLRDKIAKKLGFENYVDLGYLKLGRSDYNSKMVEGYRKQIADSCVALCQKLYSKQMKSLNIKQPQFFDYNLRFADGNAKPAGDCEYLVNVAHKMYSNLSEESKEYFDFMVNHELLDLEARKGKSPGGYCTHISKYKAPFIFANFNGTEGDVNVLTHEGGHAFQGYMCRNMKIPELMNPTLESCEIHSMSMEFFAWPYMNDFFKKDEKKYKYSHLCDAIEFLPYGISVDEFQHWVYEHPNASHEDRCKIWREIEKKYTPHKKYDYCPTLNKGTYWMRQHHIFSSPFYYIDYTLAQVVAFQFLAEDRKDHKKAWNKYVKLCKCGGKYPFITLLEKNHLHNPFKEGMVKRNINPLKKILKEIEL